MTDYYKLVEALIELMRETDATPWDIKRALPEAWHIHSEERRSFGNAVIRGDV